MGNSGCLVVMEVGPCALLIGTRSDPWEGRQKQASGWNLITPHPALGLQEGRSARVLEVNSTAVGKGRKPAAMDTREHCDNVLQDALGLADTHSFHVTVT